jgi:hypothetical protein
MKTEHYFRQLDQEYAAAEAHRTTPQRYGPTMVSVTLEEWKQIKARVAELEEENKRLKQQEPLLADDECHCPSCGNPEIDREGNCTDLQCQEWQETSELERQGLL